MMRSLYAGVSGLKTHQTKMDVIGNNIANVNTVAYKSSSITFNELMYQTTQRASGPNATTGTGGVNPRQIGLGVKTGAINTNITSPGATQTTGNPFDIKITGDAFFVVSNGKENMFTRDGSFYVDAAGNLAMSSNGYNVMGWQPDPTNPEMIKKDTVSALRVMNETNMTYPPAATTKATVSGILDKNDKNVNSESGRSTSLQFYDALGYSYNAKISYHATTKDGQYYMQLDDITDSTGKSVMETYKGATSLDQIVTLGTRQNVDVDETHSMVGTYTDPNTGDTYTTAFTPAIEGSPAGPGNIPPEVTAVSESYTITHTPKGGAPVVGTAKSSADILGSATDFLHVFGFPLSDVVTANATMGTAAGTIHMTKKSVQGGVIQFETGDKGTLETVNGAGKTIMLDFKDSVAGSNLKAFSDITIDLSTVTRYDNSNTSTIGADPGDSKGLDAGRKLGAMTEIGISNNGEIIAVYDNGGRRLLGQIAVAEFANASGLEKSGDNLYKATNNSGNFDGVGQDITANQGYMQTGALEMSNVDLSSEFTELITTQRGFQANSRIITNSDSMLEELVNLKR